MNLTVPAPSSRALAAMDLRCQQLTEDEIAYRMGRSVASIRVYLATMREWYGVADTVSAAYLHGRTQGTSKRRRRVRDDELTLW